MIENLQLEGFSRPVPLMTAQKLKIRKSKGWDYDLRDWLEGKNE